MTYASQSNPVLQDTIHANGRCYEWSEDPASIPPRATSLGARRDALGALFSTTVLPGLERRGATRRVLGAGRRGAQTRAHWVTWQCAGDARPVWALYVSTRPLAAHALAELGKPANDGAMLAAWGDGPAMAWASERTHLRATLREALRALPEFLSEGVVSGDPAMPLRIRATTR